jgi:hypothetical protein
MNRFFLKTLLKLRNKVTPKEEVSEEEKISLTIIKKVLKLENTELIITPVLGKRIVSNKDKDIHVVIHLRNVHIISQTHGYTIYINNDEIYRGILESFDNTLEEQGKKKEIEIQNNVTFNLNSILSILS